MNKTEELQQLAQKSLYLGLDGDPIYAEHFSRLNKEIQILSDALYSVKGDTPEEEAGICLALLMGYNATIYSDKDKEAKKTVHSRSCLGGIRATSSFFIKMSVADVLLW